MSPSCVTDEDSVRQQFPPFLACTQMMMTKKKDPDDPTSNQITDATLDSQLKIKG
jgi:hypothetical protein